MREFLAVSIVAAGLISGFTLPAGAYTLPDGTVNSDNQYFSTGSVYGNFSHAYSFTLTDASDVNASFSGNPGTKFTLSDLAIYEVGTNKKETTSFSSQLVFSNFVAGTDTVFLDPGSYYIGVTGKSYSSKGTYDGTLAISEVPLPPSLGLFGIAIAGLGLLGVARKSTGGGAIPGSVA